jgi:hypothetical protein
MRLSYPIYQPVSKWDLQGEIGSWSLLAEALSVLPCIHFVVLLGFWFIFLRGYALFFIYVTGPQKTLPLDNTWIRRNSLFGGSRLNSFQCSSSDSNGNFGPNLMSAICIGSRYELLFFFLLELLCPWTGTLISSIKECQTARYYIYKCTDNSDAMQPEDVMH